MAAAHAIVHTQDRSRLVEFGGHIELGLLFIAPHEIC